MLYPLSNYGSAFVCSRETIHCPFGGGGRAIMQIAFGRVRRKIARLRTRPKIQNGYNTSNRVPRKRRGYNPREQR